MSGLLLIGGLCQLILLSSPAAHLRLRWIQQPMPSALGHLPTKGQSPALVALGCPGIT